MEAEKLWSLLEESWTKNQVRGKVHELMEFENNTRSLRSRRPRRQRRESATFGVVHSIEELEAVFNGTVLRCEELDPPLLRDPAHLNEVNVLEDIDLLHDTFVCLLEHAAKISVARDPGAYVAKTVLNSLTERVRRELTRRSRAPWIREYRQREPSRPLAVNVLKRRPREAKEKFRTAFVDIDDVGEGNRSLLASPLPAIRFRELLSDLLSKLPDGEIRAAVVETVVLFGDGEVDVAVENLGDLLQRFPEVRSRCRKGPSSPLRYVLTRRGVPTRTTDRIISVVKSLLGVKGRRRRSNLEAVGSQTYLEEFGLFPLTPLPLTVGISAGADNSYNGDLLWGPRSRAVDTSISQT